MHRNVAATLYRFRRSSGSFLTDWHKMLRLMENGVRP
jgi:hypothetical protein